jgi:4'-phosphopantetheinyl transferase EntD
VKTPSRSADLEALFPDGIVVFAADERWAPPALTGAEAEAVARAVAGRRAEFARGRACARAALDALGHGRPAIPMGPSRAPQWPTGVRGTITHCRGLVAAAVCGADTAAAIGLDAEPVAPLEDAVAERIATPEERADAARRSGTGADAAARLVFSAKEVVHKCVHPLTGVVLDFLDVAIVFDADGVGFSVEPRSERARSVDAVVALRGRYRVDGTHVVAAGTVPGHAARPPASGRAADPPA